MTIKTPAKMPTFIAVAGGSGSGKSTFVRMLVERLEKTHSVAALSLDHYYYDLSDMNAKDRQNMNFDHPEAIDAEQLARDIEALQAGKTIERPQYDFATHTRSSQGVPMVPVSLIILDSIFSLSYPAINKLLQIKIYIDLPSDLRLLRRLRRDTAERGRSVESVLQQYEQTVRPMHVKHIEPCKDYADLVIPWEKVNEHAVDLTVALAKGFLA